MRRTLSALTAALVWGALGATPVWAVSGLVAVTVTGPTGPVAGAKVRVGDEVTTTDAQGRAEMKVEEGTRTVEVEHPDHVTARQTVEVRAGATTRADVSLGFLSPFMIQNPGGVFGGFSVGPFGLVHDWKLDVTREVERLRIGTTAGGTSTTITAVDQSPNRFEIDVKAGGVDAAFGLPGFSAGGWSFVPGLSLLAGGADVEIKNTESDRKISGGGWLAGGGLELAAVPSGLPRSYVAVGWQGWWMRASDMDFEVDGRDLCRSGIFASFPDCRRDTTVTAQTHELYARAGYGFLNNRVAPFAGIKYRMSDLELRTDVSARSGVVEVRDDLDIDFELGRCECILGIAGVDLRGPDVGELGRLFGRVQTEFNGSGYSVLFKLMFGFGFVDP